MWQELGALVSGFLDSKHLSDIVDDTDGALDALDVLGAGLCK